MRNRYFILILILCITVIYSCEKPLTKNKEMISKEEINIFLDHWHKDAAEANENSYFSKFDTNSFFIGTDASENWALTAFKVFSSPFF